MRGGRGHSRAVAHLRADRSKSPELSDRLGDAAGVADPGKELVFEHRRSEYITLDRVAAHRQQYFSLGGGLDRFGDDLAADALDQVDHRLDHDPRRLAFLDVGYERRI